MTFKQYLKWFLLVAAAYIGSGFLASKFLLMPPSLVPMVWPPVGIALGAVLVAGWKLLPVVPVSLFISTVLIGWSLGAEADYGLLYLVSSVLAVGATLQTAVGVWLCNRLLDRQKLLDTQVELWRALAMCVPVSCAIGPAVGTFALSLDNSTPPDGEGYRWLGWWLANMLACCVFTPLVLSLTAQPRSIWKPRLTTVVLPLMVTLAAGVWVIKSANDWRMQQVVDDFNQLAGRLTDAAQKALQQDATLLEGVALFVAARQRLEESEFLDYSDSLLLSQPSIQAIEWLPRQMQESEEVRYPVLWASTRNQQGLPVPQTPHPDRYLQPSFKVALEKVLSNPAATMTSVIWKDHQGQYSLLLPVFTSSHSSRSQAFTGVVAIRYDLQQKLMQVWKGLELGRVNIIVEDVTLPNLTAPVFAHQPTMHDGEPDSPIQASNLSWQRDLPLAGRIWRFRIQAKPSWFLSLQRHENTLFQVLTVLFMMLLCGFLMMLSGRDNKVREMVKARTRDLDAANQRMQQLLAEREQALRVSGERELALSRSNKELEQYAYVVSHDLKSPLRSMQGFADLLSKRYVDALDSKGVELFGYISAGAQRMTTLLDDLLDLSQVESSGKNLRPVLSDRVLKEVLQDLDAVIREAGAVVCIGKMPRVMADESQFRSLLTNLLGNAIKYRNPGEPPRINITASPCNDSEHWVFEVQDNGIGIAAEYSEQVFALFRRLHTADRYEGTGIGLALCKKIVERHSGRIWVESEEGKGSRFFFTLPVVQIAPVCPNRTRMALEASQKSWAGGEASPDTVTLPASAVARLSA